jgi:hypothetical protein
MTSPVDGLLARLDRVRKTGTGRWSAKCPAHDDRGPSLSIRELEDGRILLHDFAGCSLDAIVGALGIRVEDLFPPRTLDPHQPARRERKPWRSADVIAALGFEVSVGIVILSDVARGRPIADPDRARAGTAAVRMTRFMTELQNAH